jgi:hypothetical protein
MPRAGFDDLGVSRSEIVTLNNYFIYFSHNFLVNSDSELLFPVATTSSEQRVSSVRRFQSVRADSANYVNSSTILCIKIWSTITGTAAITTDTSPMRGFYTNQAEYLW